MTTIHRYSGFGGSPAVGSRRNYTYESDHPAGGDARRKIVQAEVHDPVALWYRNTDGVWMIRRIAEYGDLSNDTFVVLPARLVSQT